MRPRTQHTRGFTLVEVLVVVAILGIIAAIAVPQYQQYSFRANRTEGQAMLNNVMMAQDRFYATSRTYTADLTQLGLPVPLRSVPDGLYVITASNNATCVIANCIILTATAQGTQTGDKNTLGGNMTLNSRGVKTGW